MAVVKPAMTMAWSVNGVNVKPADAKIDVGWIAEKPPFQSMNWVQNRADEYLQHLNERGVPLWDALTLYIAGAKAQATDGTIYTLPAGGGTSINENPTAGTPWVKEVAGIANEWEANQVILEKVLAFGASIPWDVSIRQNASITLTADMTFTALNNPVLGGVYVLRVVQDATAGRVITWPANVKWPNGTVPILSSTANASNLITFYYDGVSFLGNGTFEYV